MRIVLPLLIGLLVALSACAPRIAATTATPSQPGATPTTRPTPTIDTGACLQGDWILNPATAESLLVYLSSIPSMTILEGTLRISFDNGKFAYHSDDLFLRTSFLNGFLDARAKVLIEGTYVTDGNKIQFTKTSAQNELYDWRAVDANGDVQPFYSTSPIHDFVIAEAGTFDCSDGTLHLTFEASDLEGMVFDLARVK